MSNIHKKLNNWHEITHNAGLEKIELHNQLCDLKA